MKKPVGTLYNRSEDDQIEMNGFSLLMFQKDKIKSEQY